MRIIVFLCVIGICGLYAKPTQLIRVMQEMEYAMNLMERGLLYNKKEWVKEGLQELKSLNIELQKIDAIVYLDKQRRLNTDIVNGIVNKSQENIATLENILQRNEWHRGAEMFGVILGGCVSCHSVARVW